MIPILIIHRLRSEMEMVRQLREMEHLEGNKSKA